jgi:hypothetical protein
MSDTIPGGDTKLGPYRLGRRLWKTDPELGRVYEAHNTETGAPALVLKPPRLKAWRVRHRWTIRALGDASPSFLAVEVDPLAQGAGLHEVTRMFIRLSGLLAQIDGREETRGLFSRPTPPAARAPQRRRGPWGGMVAAGAVALVLGAVVLGTRPSVTSGGARGAGVAETLLNEPVAWDLHRFGVPTVGFPMPATPLKGQQKPPCQLGTEVEVNGGCWIQAKQDAPCARGLAEHEGKCYVAVREPPPVPSSLEP